MKLIVLTTLAGNDYHDVAPTGYKVPNENIPISADEGNQTELRPDGIYTPAAEVDVDAIIAELKTCAGEDHTAGNLIPTCEEMTTAIADAIANLPADNFLAAAELSEDGKTLELTMETGDVISVSLADMIPVKTKDGVIGTGTVADPITLGLLERTPNTVTTGTALPTRIYGERTALLGKPDVFLEVRAADGKFYAVPAFAVGGV